jgi:hypothetical protein
MMRVSAFLLAWLLVANTAHAFAPQEQERVLEQSLTRLAEAWGGSYQERGLLVLPGRDTEALRVDFSSGPGFGETAAASVDDGDPGRQHPLGATLLTELQRLSADDLTRFVELGRGKPPGGNVSTGFLALHLRALHLAAAARDDEELRAALLEESLALSYLMDSFSSSHFFFPGRDPLDWLHRVNNRERREEFRFIGAYVLDSRGEVWQTFGDGLLRWYPYVEHRVRDAVLAALCEFFAAYYGAAAPPPLRAWLEEHSPVEDAASWRDRWMESWAGAAYYETLRLPSLLRIPWAISATWSVRDPARVEYGIASRRQWPQLRDPGGHDPELAPHILRWLPAGDEVPEWLHLPRLDSTNAQALILRDPDLASVRFQQRRTLVPSFKGGLLEFGVGSSLRGGDSQWLLSGGLGWGFVDQLLPLRQLLIFQRVSVEARGHWAPDSPDAYGVYALATQFDSGKIRGAVHLELGVADGWGGYYSGWGLHLSVGLASRSVKLPGFYLGGATRLRYSLGYMGEAVHSIFLDLLVH